MSKSAKRKPFEIDKGDNEDWIRTVAAMRRRTKKKNPKKKPNKN